MASNTVAYRRAFLVIERRQWWFGRKNILYVRPTQVAVDFIASATTWKAAEQFLPSALSAGKDHNIENKNLSSADLAIPNGIPVSDEPGLAEEPISKT